MISCSIRPRNGLNFGLHYTICLTDSLVNMLGDCVNFKAMRNESASFNIIVADKLHCVTIA